MSSQLRSNRSKRKNVSVEETQEAKRARTSSDEDDIPTERNLTAGRITKMVLRNIMCHDHLVITFNKNVNFIVGKNGSGKSAILAGLTIGLGARANVTSRGTSINALVKDDCGKGCVEITLANVGALAYKHEIYGDEITIIRTIGTTSQYKIKNIHGQVISNKKMELDRIITQMNIQVDNPISVLNQEQARTFIGDSDPTKKYILFMKATQLDIIGDNYRTAQRISYDTQKTLEATAEQLQKEQQEMETLENKLKMLESLDETRQQLNDLQIELLWSLAIAEEEKLALHEDILRQNEETYNEQKNSQQDHGSKVEQIDLQLEGFKESIQKIENTIQVSNDAYTLAKREHTTKKEEANSKQREYRVMQNEMKHLQQDLIMLTTEIKRLESGNTQAEVERNQQKQRLIDMENELRDVEAMLSTTQIQQNHMETDKAHLENETRSMKMEMDMKKVQLNRMRNHLNGLNQQSNDNLTVFGRNVPRLLKRINEEYSKGRFVQKPCGPIGAFMKMKDSAWTPAVESFLGYGLLSGFCVDNANDARVLGNLIKEVYIDESGPSITCSKFHKTVHNVGNRRTGTNEYKSLLDSMEITNPVAANCLIDQREPECILLIPTSGEAKHIMGNRQNVPRNCRRALTQKGDTFFPDPKYRCYSSKVAQRAKWLQVSTKDAISSLQDEIKVAEKEYNRVVQEHQTICEKLQRNLHEYNGSHQKVMQLSSLKNKLKIKIEQANDSILEDTNDNCEVFKQEKVEKEKQIETIRNREKEFREEIKYLENELKELEAKVHSCRAELNKNNEEINNLKGQIRDLQGKKKELELNAGYNQRRLDDIRLAYEKSMASVEKQKASTTECVRRAEEVGPRVNTERTPPEINRLSKKLQVRIKTVQEEFGSIDEIRAELEEKRLTSANILETFKTLTATNISHCSRVESRRKEFHQMKRLMAAKVKQAFANVLELRSYDGTIHINHADKKLQIEVYPRNAKRRDANDVQTLSGGEKSYSTVAFILALWECTTLPFYFMDEFDVFMDKVNRRVIMDILMDHTKEHPERQYGFLTPLDASIVTASDFLTIHRLKPPKRAGGTQES